MKLTLSPSELRYLLDLVKRDVGEVTPDKADPEKAGAATLHLMVAAKVQTKLEMAF